MKRFVGIMFSIWILLAFVSCGQSGMETISETESESQIAEENTEIVLDLYQFYRSFEDTLSDVADVMIGEYRGINNDGHTGYYRYEDFAVVSQLKGGKTTDIITVVTLPAECTVEEADISYSLSKTQYKKGQTYLLLLKRSSSTGANKDKFVSVQDSLLIPLDASQNVIKEKCLLYGTKLSEHFFSQATTDAWNNGTFLTYILDYVENQQLTEVTDP